MYQIITLYTLNVHNVVSQLYLNKTGGKLKIKLKKNSACSNFFQMETSEDRPLCFVPLLCSLTSAGDIGAAIDLPPIMG